MVAGQADLHLDGASHVAKGATFCEADHAAFVAVGLDAVLHSEQLAEERFCHWGSLHGFLLVRLVTWVVVYLNC